METCDERSRKTRRKALPFIDALRITIDGCKK
jgi:hypothetical protein